MNDVDNRIKKIVEGLLLAAGKPLSLDMLLTMFSDEERPERNVLRQVLDSIAADCEGHGYELKEVASGYRFQVRQELAEWIGRLWEEKPPRYTRALLETLALVAYRQPITRGDIEEIRGVAVSPNIIRTLLDREWIRIVGHKDVPGKPAMFATTKQFLDYFNLASLQDLPPLSEVRELAKDKSEFDLDAELAQPTVLALPETSEDAEPEADPDAALMEEAIALSKRPLDEILGIQREPELDLTADDRDEAAPESPVDAGSDGEASSEPAAHE